MAYYYAISKTKSIANLIASECVSQIFRADISFLEEDGVLLLVVESVNTLPDDEIFIQVQRECDRITFLTGEALEPRFVRKDNPNGSTTTSDSRMCRTAGWCEIPADIAPQQWDDALQAQLSLWHLATLRQIPVVAKIMLLFQIIEIAFPDTKNDKDYPEYKDSTSNPASRTEAKLLRDLATHGKKPMRSRQVQCYCMHHSIKCQSNDPTDAELRKLFNLRLTVIEEEARRIIHQSITRS